MSTNLATERPRFSSNNSAASEPQSEAQTSNKLTELIEQRKQRPEVGAIWIKQAKTSSMEFLKIRLRLTRSQLQGLLDRTPEGLTEQDLPIYELVAFPNSTSNENNKRPAFRIYEAKE